MRHVKQSLAVAARTGADLDTQFELVALVDDYVFGHVLRTVEVRASLGDDARAAARFEGALARDPERFERGLQRLLDGIELDLERRRA